MRKKEEKFFTQLTILILILIISMGLVLYYAFKITSTPTAEPVATEEEITEEQPEIVIKDLPATSTKTIIGTSVEGRNIENYTYGTGTTTLLFVGGIHGGYEWNSVLLAYKFIDELEAGLIKLPDNFEINIIPVLNPDGLYAVTKTEGKFTVNDVPAKSTLTSGQGRFNANDVDLNRNFACKWAPSSTWRGEVVSAGTSAFSEPEAQALRKLVGEVKPKAVIFWHSQANTVYASECENGILPNTLTLMSTYAKAAGYNEVKSFDAYPITGDAEGWLASIGIPAITVELETHETIEWERNKAGIKSILELY